MAKRDAKLKAADLINTNGPAGALREATNRAIMAKSPQWRGWWERVVTWVGIYNTEAKEREGKTL